MLAILFLLFSAAPPDLTGEFARIASEAHGHSGASAMLIETGETASFHGTDRFPMQSVYKFPIAMAVLHDVDLGLLRLDQAVKVAKAEMVPPALRSPLRDRHPNGAIVPLRELLRFAVSESDGTASDVLFRLAGGAARITQYLRDLGIDGVMIATTEMAMSRDTSVQYRNWAQPAGMAALLRAFHEGRGLLPASRTLLHHLMVHTPTGPNRLKGLLPPEAEVAHKTGTSGTAGGLTAATNDVGIITLPDGRHAAIAVFVSDSPASLAVRERVIARIARAAWDHWIKAGR
jgi:beta-lactamase class A